MQNILMCPCEIIGKVILMIQCILRGENRRVTNGNRNYIRSHYAIQSHEVAYREYHCAAHVFLGL